MTKLLFEVSPAWILICVLAATAYTLVLYFRAVRPWGTRLNLVLAALRWVLVFLLTLLLLNFMLRHIENRYEEPVFAILLDNSASVQAMLDSPARQDVVQRLARLKEELEKEHYEVPLLGIRATELQQVNFNEPVTNLSEALRLVAERYEDRQLEGVLLVSDGIYNAGLAPADVAFPAAVYTLGVGDTVRKPDLSIRDVWYNKIAYQGSRFPVRAEITAHGFTGRQIKINLLYQGRVVQQQQMSVPASGFIAVEFATEATGEGLQRWEVVAEVLPEESNPLNNRATLFVEVIRGRRKILIAAAAPHPDLGTLRTILESNNNYEIMLHLPGVTEVPADKLKAENIDLVIFYQLPDFRGRLRDLTLRLAEFKLPRLFIAGGTTDVNFLVQPERPLGFETPPRQFDEVTPSLNPQFSLFTLPENTSAILAEMPPLPVHFGKMRVSPQVIPVLFQQVGSVVTDRPMLAYFIEESRKTGVMLGEGIYRWRMYEYAKTGRTEITDELFTKFIQFLVTAEDKRRFRCYPVKPEFTRDEPVVLESEVYNEIFEPVFGNTVTIEIFNEQNRRSAYSYVVQPSLSRYSVYSLPEGAYRFTATTEVNAKPEKVNGQFVVTGRKLEMQNLTADYGQLRRLSAQTGGRFYHLHEWDKLAEELTRTPARYVVHSEERYTAALNIPWILILLLVLVSAEWFLRKFYGGY
ncbi:MAG: hypothetical protein KatS3mg032_1787 [Cyclobacteriaceae bacterium]|nr:MAG: hypothetical protein KatS3mg032_1787 [Cyclobacteriaceae bacterium]